MPVMASAALRLLPERHTDVTVGLTLESAWDVLAIVGLAVLAVAVWRLVAGRRRRRRRVGSPPTTDGGRRGP